LYRENHKESINVSKINSNENCSGSSKKQQIKKNILTGRRKSIGYARLIIALAKKSLQLCGI
jgi:hypothetical protein